jgi:hypothetical protein
VNIDSSREPLVDPIWKVNVDNAIAVLGDNPPKETVDQLYDFGKFLLDQARSLRNSYDAKLTSCLGWASGLLVFVLVGNPFKAASTGTKFFASMGAISAMASVIIAIIGLRSKPGLKWPSEKDWFDTEAFAYPASLKIQHVVAILEAHQSYNSRVQEKGYCMTYSEYALAVAGVLLGLAAIYNFFSMPG